MEHVTNIKNNDANKRPETISPEISTVFQRPLGKYLLFTSYIK